MERPHDAQADAPPAMPSQSELEAVIDADEAPDETVPQEPVLAAMRATAERIRREREALEGVVHRQA